MFLTGWAFPTTKKKRNLFLKTRYLHLRTISAIDQIVPSAPIFACNSKLIAINQIKNLSHKNITSKIYNFNSNKVAYFVDSAVFSKNQKCMQMFNNSSQCLRFIHTAWCMLLNTENLKFSQYCSASTYATNDLNKCNILSNRNDKNLIAKLQKVHSVPIAFSSKYNKN